jgi:predicted component of type VI protein secretion system
MPVTLTVATYKGQPPAQAMSQRFEGTVVTLGRGAEADWSLPDPEQHLSKKHCTIQLQGGQYSITDTSTNGLFINGAPQPLGRGQSTPLKSGDRLGLGDYEVAVRIETGTEASAGFGAVPFQPFANAPAGGGFGESDPFGLGAQESPFAPAPGGADPFGGAAGGGFGADPFAAPPAAPQGGFALGAEPFAAPAGQGNPLIPSDFGAAFPPDPALAPPLPGGGGSGPLIPEGHDFLGGAPSPSAHWQQEFSRPDHIPAANAFFKPPEVAPPTIPDKWDAVFAAPGGATAPQPAAPAAPPVQGGFGVPLAGPAAPAASGGVAGPPPARAPAMPAPRATAPGDGAAGARGGRDARALRRRCSGES